MSLALGILIRAAVILAVAACVVLIARGRLSAGGRYIVWKLAVVAVLAVPVLSLVSPKIELPLLEPHTVREISSTVPDFVTSSELDIPAAENSQWISTATSERPVTREWSWMALLVGGWALGGLLVLLRSLHGLCVVRSLWNSADPPGDDRPSVLLESLRCSLRIRRGVELRVTSENIPPMTWGVRRPGIVLPESALRWSDARLRLVLLHELSHVKRKDGLTQFLSQLSCALYWMNPLIWLAAQQMRLERERACDDCVLVFAGSAEDYAGHLLDIARTLNGGVPHAAVSMAHHGHLEARMRAILNPLARRWVLSRPAVTVLMMLTALFTLSLVALRVTAMVPILSTPPPRAVPWGAVTLEPEVQAAVAAPARTGTNAASLSGTVVKLGSTEGLGETRIDLLKGEASGVPAYTTTTKPDGAFTFTDLEAGEYRIVATRSDGFLSAEYGQKAPYLRGLPISLKPGDAVKSVILGMAASGAIAGVVRDPDGDPVGHAQVQALRVYYRDGQRRMTIAQSVQTNDRGEYRLYWLTPGSYYLSAQPTDTQAQSVWQFILPPQAQALHEESSAPVIHRRALADGRVQDVVFPLTYFPGTPEIAQAAAVAVRNGDDLRGIDLQLATSVPARRVRGIVIDGVTGQPSKGALVRAVPRASGPNVTIPYGTTDEQGRFEIRGMAAGGYEVFVMAGATPFSRTAPAARAVIEVADADLENLALTIAPFYELLGRFVVEGKDSVDSSQLQISMRRTRVGIFPMQEGSGAPQADGSFVIRSLIPGDYTVGLTTIPGGVAQQGVYVKSIRFGAQDVLKDGLRLDTSPQDRLEVTVGFSTAEVHGTVVTVRGELAANSAVVLVPDSALPRAELYKSAATDAAGRFAFKGIVPGNYRLFAWEDVRAGEWFDPDFMRKNVAVGTPIQVNESTQEEKKLTVFPVQR